MQRGFASTKEIAYSPAWRRAWPRRLYSVSMERLLWGPGQSRPGDPLWDHNDTSGFMESMD